MRDTPPLSQTWPEISKPNELFLVYISFMFTTSICDTYVYILFTVVGTMSNALFPPCARLNVYNTRNMPSKFIFNYLRGCFSLRHSFCLACLDAANPNPLGKKKKKNLSLYIDIVGKHKQSAVKDCPWRGADALQF